MCSCENTMKNILNLWDMLSSDGKRELITLTNGMIIGQTLKSKPQEIDKAIKEINKVG